MKVIGTILCKVEKDDIIDDKLIIPDNITEIADNAFFGCKTINEIIIPKTIKIISPNIFRFCASLKKINFKSSLFHINSMAGILGFFDLNGLESISICGRNFDITNNLKNDLESQKKYINLMRDEVLSNVFKEIELSIIDINKEEVRKILITSNSIKYYADKIVENIIKYSKYDYKNNIKTLASNFYKSYFDSKKQSKNNQKKYISALKN